MNNYMCFLIVLMAFAPFSFGFLYDLPEECEKNCPHTIDRPQKCFPRKFTCLKCNHESCRHEYGYYTLDTSLFEDQ